MTPIDFCSLPNPILTGNAVTAFRDPAAVCHDGLVHLFYTYVRREHGESRVAMYTAVSTSRDLAAWSPPRVLTPKDRGLNFSSPGNVVRVGDEWVLCLQTYPRPNGEKYGTGDARLWTMRSRDLREWLEPQLLRVKGPDIPPAEMGRMIDPYLLRDKDTPGRWWCFYKQNGISLSSSDDDLRTWTPAGRIDAGENPCVIVDGDEYVLFYSPDNGIGIKRSPDGRTWRDGPLLTFGQADWPWARHGRLTAGCVLDLRHEPRFGRYVMFFHASEQKEEITFDDHCHIGIAWSDDLRDWAWA